MRVLVVCSRYPIAKHDIASIFVREEVELLRKLGLRIDVLRLPIHEPLWAARTRPDVDDAPNEVFESSVPWPATVLGLLESPFRPSWRTVFRIREIGGISSLAQSAGYLLSKSPYDLLNAHFAYTEGCAVGLAALKANKPYVVSVHGSDIVDQTFVPEPLGGTGERAAPVKAVLEHSRYVISPSKFLADRVNKSAPKARVVVVPHGVDGSRFSPAGLGPAITKRSGTPSVLFVGDLIPKKGVMLLLEAMKQIVEEEQQVKLDIVGEGPLRAWIEARISSGSLATGVRLLGRISPELLVGNYRSHTLLALPSRDEGFGKVLIEAMACGLPIVASASGAIPEIVDHGKTGLLFEAGNILSLKSSLLSLLQNPDMRREMGLAARETCLTRFDASTSASRIREIYENAASA